MHASFDSEIHLRVLEHPGRGQSLTVKQTNIFLEECRKDKSAIERLRLSITGTLHVSNGFSGYGGMVQIIL